MKKVEVFEVTHIDGTECFIFIDRETKPLLLRVGLDSGYDGMFEIKNASTNFEKEKLELKKAREQADEQFRQSEREWVSDCLTCRDCGIDFENGAWDNCGGNLCIHCYINREYGECI